MTRNIELVRRFAPNIEGRDFVVGDIHGCFDALCVEMDRIQFNPAVDRMFSVGDLVDRGAQSADAIDWIAQPWFHSIRGNHEEMAILSAAGALSADMYAANGGAWFLALAPDQQKAIAQVFLTLPIVIEVSTPAGLVGLVHAEPQGLDWPRFVANVMAEDSVTLDLAVWARTRYRAHDTRCIQGVRVVYVGHTPVAKPIELGNVRYIDTGAVFGKSLTVVELTAGLT